MLMKLPTIILVEIVLFWFLLYSGILLDKAMPDPKRNAYMENMMLVNVQIVLITLVSIYGRPFVLSQLGTTSSKVYGVGLLYAYALLLGQNKFKVRVNELTKL